MQGKEGIKGQHWFMEADMRQTQTLRPDKTGKALLTVLRHLGRLHEVRATCSICPKFGPCLRRTLHQLPMNKSNTYMSKLVSCLWSVGPIPGYRVTEVHSGYIMKWCMDAARESRALGLSDPIVMLCRCA